MAHRPRADELAEDSLLMGLRAGIIDMVHTKNLPDLSMRQLAVLLMSHTADEPQTVRGLAGALGVQKPIVTRALDRLEDHALVRRIPDPADRRSVFIELTKSGHALARSFGRLIPEQAGMI
jgi:DNA-binding MarR family transcriptional regulator